MCYVTGDGLTSSSLGISSPLKPNLPEVARPLPNLLDVASRPLPNIFDVAKPLLNPPLDATELSQQPNEHQIQPTYQSRTQCQTLFSVVNLKHRVMAELSNYLKPPRHASRLHATVELVDQTLIVESLGQNGLMALGKRLGPNMRIETTLDRIGDRLEIDFFGCRVLLIALPSDPLSPKSLYSPRYSRT